MVGSRNGPILVKLNSAAPMRSPNKDVHCADCLAMGLIKNIVLTCKRSHKQKQAKQAYHNQAQLAVVLVQLI